MHFLSTYFLYLLLRTWAAVRRHALREGFRCLTLDSRRASTELALENRYLLVCV